MPVETSATARSLLAELERLGDPKDAEFLKRFFKTAPGEYGAGDRFLGIRVPVTRKLVRQHRALPLQQITALLHSQWHEARLLALLILVDQHRRAAADQQSVIHRLYLDNTRHINNWDLVDLSAEHLVGPHIAENAALLPALAASASLWERRIAIMATFHPIRRGEFAPTLRIAELLLDDEHDLIHKAVGWMLREVGNRDRAIEERFLKPHYQRMPRTMLRYAIEKFPEALRQRYLKGKV
ncbi:MAG: DNA alkylation repair protein [Proteobacteria bacterium]|nr:MAG: DNA alkylation repair protein [Pseudomonadota bacterium]QKK11014.1 MAG: DNA alkylation repair protein [Pseudomonadota bacterium]